MSYSPEEALAAMAGKPPAAGGALSPEQALQRARGAAPAATAKPSSMPRLDVSGGISKAIRSAKGAEDLKPAIDRALSWVSDTLEQTDYGRTYKAEVSSAEASMSEGVAHMKHAQGPLAAVEGMGGLAQTGIGALAFLFSPITALVEEGAVKPAQTITRKVAGDSPAEQRVEGLEEFGIQALAGAAGGEGGLARSAAVREAAQAKAARINAQKLKMQSNLAELAVKDPAAAESLVKYVGQVDPVIEKHMRKIVKASVKASDEDLKKIGRTSVEADILTIKGAASESTTSAVEQHAEMLKRQMPAKEPQPETRSPKGKTSVGAPVADVVSDAARHAAMLRRMTPERLSAVMRTAVQEGYEAVNMTMTPEERAAHRESIARRRDAEEGMVHKFQPEVIPKNAAIREGEAAKRDAADPAPKDDGIVHFNMGIPVTKQQVSDAFNWLKEKSPSLKIAEAKLARVYEGIFETFNPEALGIDAKKAGVAVVQAKYEESRRQLLYWERGKDRRNYFIAMGKEVSLKFLEGAEKRIKFANKQWEENRLFYAKWNDDMYKQDMKTGLEYDPRDHYFAHIFVDGDGALNWLKGKYANRWADPRFIKERSFDLYKEAIAQGFTPKYTNPEEIMQARQHASDIAQLRTNLLADFEKRGIAIRAEKGKEVAPPGYYDKAARSPTGQRYWVKESAQKILYNAYDSPTLWNLQGSPLARGTSQAFRGWMGAKNAVVPIKLMWSGFHPLHVTHIDAAADMTRAQELALTNPSAKNVRNLMTQLATGTPTSPVGAAGILYRAWWDNPRTGWPLLRFFQGKREFSSLSDADKAASFDMADGGFIPVRPKEETSGQMQKWKDAVRQHSSGAIFRLPMAALSGLNYPIYNLWIPSLKTAAYIKDVRAWREMNPKAADGERQMAFRGITRRVESRYGEMNYDTMLMHKMAKDIGTGLTLSLGWQLGLLDQYGGGAVDAAKLLVGKGSVREGTASRPLFVMNYVATALTIGGWMTYWLAHRKPEGILDYTNPDSGEKDEYGKPIRLNTPFYTHEGSSLTKHIQQEGVASGVSDFVWSKGSGMYDLSKTVLTGLNGLDNEIRDPKGAPFKQLEQTLQNMYGDFEPISMKDIGLQDESAAPKMRGLSVAGFSPAGKYIDRTAVEGQINAAFNDYVRPKKKPFQAVQMSKDTKELRRLFKSDKSEDGDKYEAKLDQMVKDYDLDPKDTAKMQKQFNKDQDFDINVYMFSKLQWAQQKPLLDQMKPEEREEYLRHVSKQKRAKYERESEE